MADVVIVGAGPAGSIAAKKLSDYGFKVSLYEKERIPRHKHCAGYISYRIIKALDSINIHCRGIISQRVCGWRIQYGDEYLDLTIEGDNLPANVYREKFDHFLTQCAAKSGTKIFDSTKVFEIKMSEKGRYSVVTESGREECDIILGADGDKSIVRRSLGITYPPEKRAFTIEAEVPVEEEVIDAFNEKNFMSMNYFQGGYAWAFPKKRGKTVNVGVIVSVKEAKRLDEPIMKVWERFLGNLEWYKDQKVIPHREVMPFKGTVNRLGYKNGLLLGDAAGLVEPVGAEGIPYAIESGINAAEAVKLHLEKKIPLLDIYNDLMKEMLDEINVYGVKMHNQMYDQKRIKTLIKLIIKNEDLRNAIIKKYAGLVSYKQLMKELSIPKLILAYIKSLF